MTRTGPSTDTFPGERTCPFDPSEDYLRLATEEPVSRVRLWNDQQVWLVTRFDDVRAVLGDRRFSADISRPGFPLVTPQFQVTDLSRSFIRMDPPEHTRLRRMLTGEFTVRRIEAMRPAVERIVDGLLDAMEARRPPADLVETFAMPVPSKVICELLGVPYEDHGFFQSRSRTLLDRRSSREQIRTASDELGAYLDGLVSAKEREHTDDLLGRLVVTQFEEGRLEHEELVTIARLLLVAGHETTANMIGLSTFALLENPDQLDRIRSRPSLVNTAVEELLRFLSIVQSGLPRLALEDVPVGDQVIRAGEGVIAMLPVANRDGAEFDDPSRLDVLRAARHHVAFGYGVHQCLGQTLARLELRVALGRLVARFPRLSLAVPASQVPIRKTMLVHGVQELPVTW